MQLAADFFVAVIPHNGKRILRGKACGPISGITACVIVQSSIVGVHRVDVSFVFTAYGIIVALTNYNRPYFLCSKEDSKETTAILTSFNASRNGFDQL